MFSNFVSLGCSCFTASSMSKYGLRSCSGPFDWLITEKLEWILHYLDNCFDDFLDRECLEPYQLGMNDAFRDGTSGFLFLHEGKYPVEDKAFLELKEKYKRRIDRFLKITVMPTCFLRLCSGIDEVKYISEEYDYINRVIKKNNSRNEIIFLIRSNVEILDPLKFRYYIVPEQYYNGCPSHEQLRGLFDGEEELLLYCAQNYSAEVMMKNLIVDYKKEDRFQKERVICAIRYQLLVKLMNADFTKMKIPDHIIIYGAGNLGTFFYEKIKGRGYNVECFIDEQKYGGRIDEIEICRLEDLRNTVNKNFVVTATYDFSNIYKKIMKYCADAVILSLDEVLHS